MYSNNKTMEIGKNTNKMIDRKHKTLDKLQHLHDTKQISDNKYNRLQVKYNNMLKNRIKDMHNKSAKMLCENYDEILIGKISIKSIISNIHNEHLAKIVKRRSIALSHYKYRETLKIRSIKYGSKIIEIDEYKSSMRYKLLNQFV